MSTAGARLIEMAGRGGQAGALLAAVAGAGHAGARLAAWSGLGPASAAAHLMHRRQPATSHSSASLPGRRRRAVPHRRSRRVRDEEIAWLMMPI